MRSSSKICPLIGAALLFLGSSTRATIFNIANGDVAALTSAINMANGNALDDIIELAASGTYTLTARDSFLNGLPQIGSDTGHKLTIHGNGATIQRIPAIDDSTHKFRIFEINSGANLTLTGLTLSNGNPAAFHGGAIYSNGETANTTLTIDKCAFNSNQGDYGGAIFNDGYQDPSFPAHTATLTVTNSTFSNNFGSQHGGAIWNESGGIVMNVSNSAFNQNSSNGQAGAIQFDGSNGTATGSIVRCTFSQNSARSYGGAVNVDGFSGNAPLTITNCTFDQNSASHPTLAKGWGGGLALDGSSGSAVVTVSNCTFNGNSSKQLGGGIYLSESTSGTTVLQIANTILESGIGVNIAIEDFSGGTSVVTSLGNSLSDDEAGGDLTTGPGGFLNHAGDVRNTDALLDPAGLQNNGGPTQTIALQATSPAINAGNNANAPGQDQRYYLRSGISDIGAFEYGGLLAPAASGATKPHGAAGSFAVNFPLTGTVGIESRSGGATNDHSLVETFATPVAVNGNPQAQVTTGTGQVGSGGVPNGGVVSIDATGTIVTVPLTNVSNAQQIAVTLFSVNDGTHTNNVVIPMAVLIGDTNADRFVDAVDTAQTKSKAGQGVNATNFREDINTDGFLDAVDTSFVKSKSGTALPGTIVSPLDKPPQTSPTRRPRERVPSTRDSLASPK
jgi:predicted outer membrane repeat protein